MRRRLAALVAVAALVGCAAPAPSQPTTALKIKTEPADTLCLLARLGEPRVTLSLDPSSSDQIWAISDDGMKIPVVWPDGFRVADSRGPVVLDTNGQVAGANGDVIVIPDRGMPSLRGRTVCFGSGTLFVMPSIFGASASPS